MTRIEELKHKRNASLIVVCTLGFGAIFQSNVRPAWMTNLFEGTSLDTGAIGFVLKCVCYFFLALLLAAIMFVVHLFKLIFIQIELSKLERLQQQYSNSPMGTTNRSSNSIDIFTATYYYRENNQLYGPLTIEELAVMDIRENTPLAVNNPNNWKYAGDIPDLMNTLRYVQN
ncbi:MAG: DUF4339 domain-containing protein [Prevotellaceae bacterium]|jgi:hypothetical protein|nr:DUF4339 domain-containing protein [Prevotellaceae bacterium]